MPLSGVAPVGVTMTASYRWESGWHVVVAHRLAGDGQAWVSRSYDGLVTDELAQLLGDYLGTI